MIHLTNQWLRRFIHNNDKIKLVNLQLPDLLKLAEILALHSGFTQFPLLQFWRGGAGLENIIISEEKTQPEIVTNWFPYEERGHRLKLQAASADPQQRGCKASITHHT